jgi:hypothetical protein
MKFDAASGLILPEDVIDEKASLKKVIDDVVDKTVMQHQHLDQTYFLTLHAKFNDKGEFCISPPYITYKLPQFMTNSFVFWVCNRKSICELLWMVPAKKPGQKPKPIFNENGVAYLQAKGAMPS